MVDQWIERFRNRDRLALSRLLTYVSRGEHLREIREAVGQVANLPARGGDSDVHKPAPHVFAITGNSGVGKSTLIGKLV